jgi:O-antigen ligase
MFMDHPAFGTGLGQYGIHVADYLPAWIFVSPEVRPMIIFPEAPWPAAYSLYARIAAELGLLGLAGWLALWLGMALRLTGRARAASASGGPRIGAHFPVIMNCIGVLISGIASDTLRTPMFWIALGLGCGILLRERPARLSRGPAPARLPPPHRLPR